MKWFALSFACLALSIAAAPAGAQDDQVFGKKGTPTRGKITSVSPGKIDMVVTGGNRSFDVKDILKVTFGEEPSELRTARDRALDGQYSDAVDELKKINMAEVQNAVIQQDIGYYAAYCTAHVALSEGGDKDAASERLKAFLGSNQTSFHFFEGVELLGNLYFASSKFDQAAMFYGLLAKAEWPDFKMRAAVLQGRALAAAEKYAEAGALFDQVLSNGLSTPDAVDQKMQATVGKAVCLSATGQPDQGIKMIEDLIAKNDPSDAALFGRAYNALGACYVKSGQTQNALLAYLHTSLLFFADPQAHAEALYYLAQLWDEVNKADRAVRDRSLLSTRYAGSRWASMP